MELTFDTEDLRKLCTSNLTAKKTYGSENAKYLHARLADLRAVDKIQHLPLAKIAYEYEKDQHSAVLQYPSNLKLMVTLNQKDQSQDAWQTARRLKIIKVKFYD